MNITKSPGMNFCEQLKEVLVTQGEAVIEQQPELAAHVQECAACQRLLVAWNEIPTWLERLPDFPAGEQLVQTTGAAVRADAPGRHAPRPARRHHRLLAPSLASAAVLLAAIGLSRELLLREGPRAPLHIPAPMEAPRAAGQSTPGTAGELNSRKIQGGPDEGRARQLEDNEHAPDTSLSEKQVFELRSDDAPAKEAGQKTNPGDRDFAGSPVPLAVAKSKLDNDYDIQPESAAGSTSAVEDEVDALAREIPNEAGEEVAAIGGREQAAAAAELKYKDADRPVNSGMQKNEPASTQGGYASKEEEALQDKKRAEVAAQSLGKVPELQPAAAPVHAIVASDGADGSIERLKSATESTRSSSGSAAFNFLGHYSQTDGLMFQPASGYWANTYIPGDPAIRLLSARLAQWDRSWLANNAALEQDVAPIKQPFDAPADNALSLSLMSDAVAVPAGTGATGGQLTRLRVQVGIQGIEHRRGTRPAMNVAMVVDLPPDAPDEVRIAARALLDALVQNKQAGDRFSLFITGEENGFPGLVVSADDFLFGPLQLARQAILAEDQAILSPPGVEPAGAASVPANQAFIDTHAALQQAGAMLLQTDDPSRPLGSSEVLLISARNLPDLEQLTELAHEHATAGISLSVFPLGQQTQSQQAQQLVLAGLGNRRYLETAADAGTLIEEELHASSRAVARAARLSIRLAPGVQLIGVVGSEPLDAQRAQRVRDIENSMDQRLSENLGIQADRGEDEEGIQVVIPSIYSGDGVTVLLDVVTDRPGAIADVTLRYKDLVFLRNGSLSGHLELPPGDSFAIQPERGPAELTVLKNLLAWHFAHAVEQAADALGRGQTAQAAAILRAMHATIEQARQELPDWATDPDLIHDQQVLDRYIRALDSPQAATDQSFLVDSLRVAAWAKTHTPLQEWK